MSSAYVLTGWRMSHNWLNSESESELLYDWLFTANQFVLATTPWGPRHKNIIFPLNTCGYSPYVTSSLKRGWVCHLKLLLVLASEVVLRSESRGTHDHILRSQIRDSNLVPFITSRHRPRRKHRSPLFYFNRCSGKIFVCEAVTQQRLSYIFSFRGLLSSGPRLLSRYLATGLHTTIYNSVWWKVWHRVAELLRNVCLQSIQLMNECINIVI
jgi:hypothetical protein